MSEKDFDQETVRRAGLASMGDAKTAWREGASLGRIDHFELLRELGGGGFGSVFLARDTVAGVDVAVKGLPPMVRNNAEELERIRENFALVSKLHHPHIAAALHLHPAKEVFYADEPSRQKLRVLQGDTLMVMAYAPGVTLTKWRRQFPEGKVPLPQALEVCSQVAEALDYAHCEKVVHRDVKPSNIMVETMEQGSGDRVQGSGREAGNLKLGPGGSRVCVTGRADARPSLSVKVLDFGLAAEIRSSMRRVSQEKGDTSGTRPYMAPEQWSGKKQDGRTDQYALAVLFYELVSGAVPFASVFDTGDPVIMSNVVENKQPEAVSQLSKAQNATLMRALAKEPAQRFADCASLVDALGGRVTRLRDRGRADARPSPARRAALWLAGAAVMVVVSILSARSIQSGNARRAAEEQSAKLDAAQREQVVALEAAAEVALAAGDLEKAGGKIAELDRLGGTRVSASALRKRYEAKAGERETNKRYAAASLAREEAQKLDAGQGFGDKIKALETAWREAEAARQSQGWGQALTGYDAVIASCKALKDAEVSREAAKTQRSEAEKAKAEAELAKSATDAADLSAVIETASTTQSQVKAVIPAVTAEGELKVEFGLVGGRTEFRKGEKVQYRVYCDRDCYVAVLCHQTDGSTVVLFPNAWHRNTLVSGGQEVLIPDAGSGFEIAVSPPFGTDTVELVACIERTDFHSMLAIRASETTRGAPFVADKTSVLTRGMSVSAVAKNGVLKDGSEKGWCRKTIAISTRQ
jgi:serine/threonine protein kinase